MGRTARVVVRTGTAALVASAAVGLSATAAAAHSTLLSSTPAQSAVYPTGAPPKSVSLVFDEATTATPASIGVYDGRGRGIAVVAPHGSVTAKKVTVMVPRLADGHFVVVWHVVSDDGHPEQGAITFTVGSGEATMADVGSLLARQRPGRGIGLLFGVDRALLFLSCLLFVGGVLFTRWFWPEALGSGVVRSALLSGAGLAVASTLLSIPLQAAYTTAGGLSRMVDGPALRDVLRARFGTAAVGRAAILLGLVALALFWPRRLARQAAEGLVALLALGVWATFAYGGHGSTGRQVVVGFVGDIVHLGAASLWLGGVVMLTIALGDRDELAESMPTAAARFSKLALPAIAVIVLSGAIQGWRQIGTWSALWHTNYARLLVVKVVVVIAIVIVASAARDLLADRIVPALRVALPGSSALGFEDDARSDLRNGIGIELLLAGVVLAVTAGLVVTAPGREAEAAARRPVARTVHLDSAGLSVGYSIVVQPALPGENTIVVTPRLLGQSGFLPLGLSAQLVSSGTASPVAVTFTPLNDGRWVTTAQLAAPGTWRLDLTDPARDTASVQLRVG